MPVPDNHKLLDNISVTGAGEAIQVQKANPMTVIAYATSWGSDGSVQIEISRDGTNWVSAGSDTTFTADGSGNVYLSGYMYVRANITALTGGSGVTVVI